MEEHEPRPESELGPDAEAWEKLRRLAEKHRATDDPDIAGALEAAMAAEALDLADLPGPRPGWLGQFPLVASLFDIQLGGDEVANVPGTESASVQADSPNAARGDAERADDVEKAERLIREAHIASMRSDRAKAKDLLDAAEQAAPRSAAVLVALADAALERHNVKEAARLYGLAKEAEPGNVGTERKHAEAVFRLSQGMIFDASSPAGAEAVASAKTAVVLSTMLPGVGQIVTGQTGKGLALLALWVGSWTTVVLIGFKGLPGVFGLQSDIPANPLVLGPMGLAVLFHLIAILDASARAKTAARRDVTRPVPPMDLPFE